MPCFSLGYIEPYDMPELTSEEFNAMDTDRAHRISERSLDRGIKKMKNMVDKQDKLLEQKRSKLQQLEADLALTEAKDPMTAADILKRDTQRVEVEDLKQDIEEVMSARQKNATKISEIYNKFEYGFRTSADFLLPIIPPMDIQRDAESTLPLSPAR